MDAVAVDAYLLRAILPAYVSVSVSVSECAGS